MKQLAIALLAFLGLGLSSAQAEENVMCHDIYSRVQGNIVITDTASQAPGAYHNAFRIYDLIPVWVRSPEQPLLWHTRLCLGVSQWRDWNTRYADSGMSMCVHEAGKGVYCKTFVGEAHQTFTCESTRYVYHARQHQPQREQLPAHHKYLPPSEFPKVPQQSLPQHPAPQEPSRKRIYEVRT